jgi:isoleucyl-tRNA synthetase
MSEKKLENKNPFALMEEEVQTFWEKSKTFEKSVETPAGKAPKGDYVFYDGPPFITGMPHYATLLPSIAKDMVPRYQTMKGNRVERIWGWDCHGLPAENKVEGELGLKNKQDIENLGVDKFVNACRNYVNTGSEQWRWYIERIARWVDMDHSYKTMDNEFMESVIWAFKTLHEKGLIYEGYRTSLHCPRCATPLSKFEITMDAGSYKDVQDESVVVRFRIGNEELKIKNLGDSDAFILAWTTTPWTLPGNLALAVGGDIDYVMIEKKNDGDGNFERLIIAKDLLEKHFAGLEYKVIEEFKGSKLLGLAYEPVFDLKNKAINEHENTYKIYSADFVSTQEGTGIVHIAPNFGEDDFNLGKAVALPMIDLMDETGVYTDEAGPWSGEYFKKANTRALEELGNKKFSQEKHTHSYPFCYRCNTRLIHKTQKAWYLNISAIRGKMIENNKKINWQPEYFKEGRFKINLETAPDWCLSRSRYWGSPIPVWKCVDCDEIKVVGSIKEIEELGSEKVLDLHRPNIDKPIFKCKCGGDMKRVKEVFDCWFESGAMPFAQFHFPFNEKYGEYKEGLKPEFPFPADFIIEYTGQLRGWFYYLHVLSTALFDDMAFKNVIVSGVLAGTDGRKMSKSFGNYPDPKETLHKYGADALRLYFMSSPIMTGGDTSLSEKDIQDVLRKNIMITWNVVKFYKMFNEKCQAIEKRPKVSSKLDEWILARLDVLFINVSRGFENYNLPDASKTITQFVDDLSTWYVRRSRDRFKGDDMKDKEICNQVLGYVLLEYSKIIAPVMPFIAERIWQTVSAYDFANPDKSVHLEPWPVFEEIDQVKNDTLLAEMASVRKLIEIGLSKRDEHGIKVRQPLQSFTVKTDDTVYLATKNSDEYLELIKDELNVKEVLFEKADGALLACELDTLITPELQAEGTKRELVRSINAVRKNANLTISDIVPIHFEAGQDLKEVINSYKNDIMKETLAKDLIEGIPSDLGVVKEVKINGEDMRIGL